jgi:lipopolysaccharide export LptBFGC system permease protein LptF
MVFKTLHWYILRELLRIFLMTASALTTLMAFGGTFRPFTKQGIEILQLLTIMMNLMPAMLAYAIPIAALFAAVLVYWRLSTDNELTACRASGISFVAMVMPALILGLGVASVDLVFVNYVVPIFLQRTERAVISDIGSIIVSQVNRQETIRIKDLVIYADSATEKETNDPNDPNAVVVMLDGVSAATLKNGKPRQIVTARQAEATIKSTSLPENAVELSVKLIDATAFDPKSFQRYSGTVDSLTGGESMVIPSPLRSKPKYFNITMLRQYLKDPTNFEPVKKVVDQIATIYEYQAVGTLLYEKWKTTSDNGNKPLVFQIPGNNVGSLDELRIYAPFAILNNEKQLIFGGTSARPIRVDEYSGKQLLYTYTALEGAFMLSDDELSKSGMTVSLQLRKDVTSFDHVRKISASPGATKTLAGLVLPPSLSKVPIPEPLDLITYARSSSSPSLANRSFDAGVQITKLVHTIKSELHSRGSFSVSCLLLVLLGAALGILLRGKNPLAVFVVGFVPAIFLVLLITAGRQMAEGINARNVTIGLSLIWAGNVIILAMVIGVYSKLLRQ